MLLPSDGDAPIAPSAPMSPFKAPRTPSAWSFSYLGPRSYSGTYVRYSTFRRRKKPRQENTFTLSETVRSEPPLSVRQPNVCGARIWGDEGKAVGCVPPTALLF
jgi:hypothetical protein